MSTKTIKISQSTYDTILNELRAARDAFLHVLKEEGEDPNTSDEPEAEEYRAVDAAIEELLK